MEVKTTTSPDQFTSTYSLFNLLTAEKEVVDLWFAATRHIETGFLQIDVTVTDAEVLEFPQDFARLIRAFAWGIVGLWSESQIQNFSMSEESWACIRQMSRVASLIDHVLRHPDYEFK